MTSPHKGFIYFSEPSWFACGDNKKVTNAVLQFGTGTFNIARKTLTT